MCWVPLFTWHTSFSLVTEMHVLVMQVSVFFHAMPTAAILTGKRSPVLQHSSSETQLMAPNKENVAMQPRSVTHPMASNSEVEGLKQIFPQLVANLRADGIIDQLYQSKLLTYSEYIGFIKDIQQKSDYRYVNHRILMAVKKGPKGSIARFEEILRTSQRDLAHKLRICGMPREL